MLDPSPFWKHAACSWPLIDKPRKGMINHALWFTGRTWMLPTTHTIAHGGRSHCRLRVRASVTQSTRSYTIYPWKKVVHVQSHTKPLTLSVQKSLVACLSCIKCNATCWITQPKGSGLQMFKVTSLDSRNTGISRCRSPMAFERTKATWNNLAILLKATQQPRLDTRKQ